MRATVGLSCDCCRDSDGRPVAANRSLVLGFGPCPFQHHKGRELVVFVKKGSEQQLVFECLDPLLGAMRATGADCAALVPRVERCRSTVDAVLTKLEAAELRELMTVALGNGEDAATVRKQLADKAQGGDPSVVFELCTRLVPDWSADDEMGSCAPVSGGLSGAALFKVQRKETEDGRQRSTVAVKLERNK